MNEIIGRPLDRIDGPLKTSGHAPFAAEFNMSGIAHAVMVQSEVASGRITRIDSREAAAVPGVLMVLTHENAMRLPQNGRAAVKPPAGRTLSLLQEPEIHYNGEPIGVVVAEQFEQAVDAASRLGISYATSPAKLDFGAAKRNAYAPKQLTRGPADFSWGNVDDALRDAEVRIDHVYATPMEHHNPMEPHATIAQWEGDRLTVHDSTQYVTGVRQVLAATFGIPRENVRAICPYTGGGFGCKGSTWSHVVLAAMAARTVGRPVKLVLARPQMFGPVGARPQTEQRIVLAARRDGRLTGFRHDVISHTSVMEDYAEPATQPTRASYACRNAATTQRLVQLNVGVPTFQRAPGEATGTFAMETALDELAYALTIDPLKLRLLNYAETEPSSGKPWSSKKLRECYEIAATRFGWSKRNAKPRSMKDGRWLIGWGMATATYPAHRSPASASARMLRDGRVIVQSGTQELGTGTYTIMTQIAAETLGVPVERVHAEIGDTAMPQAPVSGGSMTAASVGPAVQAACRALNQKLAVLASQDLASPLYGVRLDDVAVQDGSIMLRTDNSRRESLSALVARQQQTVEAQATAKPAEEEKTASRSFGAVFMEVRIHQDLGVLRVPRIVSAYSVGHLMNEKTGRSQLQGGIVWGLGMALFEESILDERCGRFVNANLAEYHVPVNADVGTIDVSFVVEDDQAFSPLGGRGIGEIGITGVAGALANAVFHATGKRIRNLPITIDKLLETQPDA